MSDPILKGVFLMQRSKCQECGLVSSERDLCPRCKSPLFKIRDAYAAPAQIETEAKSSVSPLRLLLTAMVLVSTAFVGYEYLRPQTQADLDREWMQSKDLDYIIGGPEGESREDKLKALKKSTEHAIALGEQERREREDKEAMIRIQNSEAQKRVMGPPQHMVPMPGNPQAMVPAPR